MFIQTQKSVQLNLKFLPGKKFQILILQNLKIKMKQIIF